MKQIFVTGASGFVGQHFRALIESTSNWQMTAAPDDFDLRDSVSIARVLTMMPAMPDAVLHLAAQSSVPEAIANPEATFETNFIGTLRLLRALEEKGFGGRFLYASTADTYGVVPESELPANEARTLRPRNPYAVSKAAAEALIYQWGQTEGLDAVIARPFNHIGPGQDDRFAVAAFARQVAEISLGRREARIHVGDIQVTRDFTDVRDVVRAYLALIERGERGQVYNIGSGSETRLGDVLNRLIQVGGIRAEVLIDHERLRPAEQRRMRADTQHIREAVSWQPRISLDQTLVDTLNFWKEKLLHD